jgi:hypothetical protein
VTSPRQLRPRRVRPPHRKLRQEAGASSPPDSRKASGRDDLAEARRGRPAPALVDRARFYWETSPRRSSRRAAPTRR